MTFHASLTVPFRLDSRPAFDRIVSLWRRAAPGLIPDRAESDEPVRHPFDPDNLDDALPYWLNQVWLARRRRPKVSANVYTGGRVHSSILIDVDTGGWRAFGELQRLVFELAPALRPDFGMLHALTAAEAAEARASGRPDLMIINRLSGEATLAAGYTRQLQHGLPALYWGNLFGPSYIDLFGLDRLLAAPAASVVEEPWGVYLQVSEEPPSDATYEKFRRHRDTVMTHLGVDAFWPDATQIAATMRDFTPTMLPTEA